MKKYIPLWLAFALAYYWSQVLAGVVPQPLWRPELVYVASLSGGATLWAFFLKEILFPKEESIENLFSAATISITITVTHFTFRYWWYIGFDWSHLVAILIGSVPAILVSSFCFRDIQRKE